jgi:hypothetical protein
MSNSEEQFWCLWALIIMIIAVIYFILVAKYCRFTPVAEMPGMCLYLIQQHG